MEDECDANDRAKGSELNLVLGVEKADAAR